jgi:nucleotide-binding universal stress UspA family protein
MQPVFKRIALAVAFSPTAPAMLAEASRLAKACGSELLLVHVGKKNPEVEGRMNSLLESQGISNQQVRIEWLNGDPARVLINTCRTSGADLLVTGALKRENLVKYYAGSIARKVLRSARCSVLTIVNPSVESRPWKNIVVNAEDSPYVEAAIKNACELGKLTPGAWIHIVRELKLYGLTMAASDQFTEEEYEGARQNLVRQEIEKVEAILQRIPHESLKVNIKVVSGKSGFELPRFAERKQADLLVIGASTRRWSLFDRIFVHDMEYILADLPCNLLVVHEQHANG